MSEAAHRHVGSARGRVAEEPLRELPVLRGPVEQQRAKDWGDVLAPSGEGGDVDLVLEPPVDVELDAAGAAVRRGHDAAEHASELRVARAVVAAHQGAQQVGLQGHGELADLVEEHVAAGRRPEVAD